jgi:hypothetical protein
MRRNSGPKLSRGWFLLSETLPLLTTCRGGQHPEWDEELRFTIQEDLDDVLIRSDSQSDSLNSSTSDAPGVTTAAALASKSRKGPISRKGGKSMRLACFADDAKEPELIGECIIGIDEVLKKGEVDGALSQGSAGVQLI